MSGQALFWSVHHWSVHYQITIKMHSRREGLTFGCVRNGAEVNRLGASKPSEAGDGNGNEEAEMHPDLKDLYVMDALVGWTVYAIRL